MAPVTSKNIPGGIWPARNACWPGVTRRHGLRHCLTVLSDRSTDLRTATPSDCFDRPRTVATATQKWGIALHSRRTFVFGAAASFAFADVSRGHVQEPDPRYRRQFVKYETSEPAGTIVVDPDQRFLYLVMGAGEALRYGVAVGREGSNWSGRATIRRKAEWPTWTPTKWMIQRDPKLARWSRGMPGGPRNPLGARALYLYQGDRDTLYRIHGTNEPWSIGRAVSSGCIRLVNDDIIDLYVRVPLGTSVLVLASALLASET